jgi:ArsR family metal-binding transcriptional regulator
LKEKIDTEAIDVKLHFPAVLPTYARFNHVFKNYLENRHEKIIGTLRNKKLVNLLQDDNNDFDRYKLEDLKQLINEAIGEDVFERIYNSHSDSIAKFLKDFIKN